MRAQLRKCQLYRNKCKDVHTLAPISKCEALLQEVEGSIPGQGRIYLFTVTRDFFLEKIIF